MPRSQTHKWNLLALLFLKPSSSEALARIVTSAEAYWDESETDNHITVLIFVTVGKSTSLQVTSLLLSDRCRVEFSNQLDVRRETFLLEMYTSDVFNNYA